MRQISTEEIRRALTMSEAIRAVKEASEEEITVFKSVGNTVEDLAVADLIVG